MLTTPPAPTDTLAPVIALLYTSSIAYRFLISATVTLGMIRLCLSMLSAFLISQSAKFPPLYGFMTVRNWQARAGKVSTIRLFGGAVFPGLGGMKDLRSAFRVSSVGKLMRLALPVLARISPDMM